MEGIKEPSPIQRVTRLAPAEGGGKRARAAESRLRNKRGGFPARSGGARSRCVTGVEEMGGEAVWGCGTRS